MNEDQKDAQDSDEAFIKPTDGKLHNLFITHLIDLTFYLQAFKSEEKKIISNLKFEDVVSLYW
jgi:hypothetical protein